jgi:hypothetical protein
MEVFPARMSGSLPDVVCSGLLASCAFATYEKSYPLPLMDGFRNIQ